MEYSIYNWRWWDANSGGYIESKIVINTVKEYDTNLYAAIVTNNVSPTTSGRVTLTVTPEFIDAQDTVGRWDLIGGEWRNDTGTVPVPWLNGTFTTNIWNPFGSVDHPASLLGSQLYEFDSLQDAQDYVTGTGDVTNAKNFLKTEWDLYYTGNAVTGWNMKLLWNCPGAESQDTADYSIFFGTAGKYGKAFGETVYENQLFNSAPYQASAVAFTSREIYNILLDRRGVGETLRQMYFTFYVGSNDGTRKSEICAVHFYYSQIDGREPEEFFLTIDTSNRGLLLDEYANDNDRDGSFVNFRNSTGENDNGYSDRKDDVGSMIEDTFGRGKGFISTYAMNQLELNSVGSKIWDDSFSKNIFTVNTAPIENCVSTFRFPFEIGGTTSEVYVGNVNMESEGGIAINDGKIFIGDFTVEGEYNSFLDLEPYTQCLLYIPFIGYEPLPISEMLGKRYQLYCIADYVTGAFKALVVYENMPFLEWDGQLGIEIPISNQGIYYRDMQLLPAYANLALSTLAGDVAGMAGTAVNMKSTLMHPTTSGSASSECASKTCVTAFILYIRPQCDIPAKYYHTFGGVCNLTYQIKNLSGFTKCAPGVDLKGIEKLTEPEKEELRSILESGFYA